MYPLCIFLPPGVLSTLLLPCAITSELLLYRGEASVGGEGADRAKIQIEIEGGVLRIIERRHELAEVDDPDGVRRRNLIMAALQIAPTKSEDSSERICVHQA